MGTTKIPWVDAVWNPVTGCSPASEGCDNCYAKRNAQSARLRGKFGYDADDPFAITYHPGRIDEPRQWRNPRSVFVCSMGDLFHPQVELVWLKAILKTMTECPQHTYILLTKRAELMVRMLPPQVASKIPNLYVGVTVELQQYMQRAFHVLRVLAKGRFISIEPMLGPVLPSPRLLQALDCVIVGGESGPNGRPMQAEWVQPLYESCMVANTCYYFKQWGSHPPNKKEGPAFECKELPWKVQTKT